MVSVLIFLFSIFNYKNFTLFLIYFLFLGFYEENNKNKILFFFLIQNSKNRKWIENKVVIKIKNRKQKRETKNH